MIVARMKRQWETTIFDTKRARWCGYYVTMTPRGEIYINRNALNALGEEDRFELLFDRPTNTIGLKPSNAASKNSQKSSKKGSGKGRVIRAYRTLQQFGVRVEKTVRFLNPEIDEDGVLILDLRQTSDAAIKRRPL